MRAIKLLLVFVVLVMITTGTGCSFDLRLKETEKYFLHDGKYDNNTLLFRGDFSAAKKSVVQLVTTAVFENHLAPDDPGNEIVERGIGTGVVVEFPAGFPLPAGKYILTAGHVASINQAVRYFPTPSGPQEVVFEKKLRGTTSLFYEGKEVALKVLMVKGEAALLELHPDLAIPALPYAFGRRGDIEVRNAVYCLSYPASSAAVNVRQGFVGDKKGIYYSESVHGESRPGGPEENYRPEDFFMVAGADILPGDSGGPVLALRDGKPEFVGLTSALVVTKAGVSSLCYVLAVDTVLSRIKSFFEKES